MLTFTDMEQPVHPWTFLRAVTLRKIKETGLFLLQPCTLLPSFSETDALTLAFSGHLSYFPPYTYTPERIFLHKSIRNYFILFETPITSLLRFSRGLQTSKNEKKKKCEHHLPTRFYSRHWEDSEEENKVPDSTDLQSRGEAGNNQKNK